MSRVPDRVPPGPIKLTYEDYVDLPDDGRRYEILDGVLEVSPAPAPRHQGVSRNVLWILLGHIQEHVASSKDDLARVIDETNMGIENLDRKIVRIPDQELDIQCFHVPIKFRWIDPAIPFNDL